MTLFKACVLVLLASAALATKTDMRDMMSKDVMVGTLRGLEEIARQDITELAPNGNRDRSSTQNLTGDYLIESIKNISSILNPVKQWYSERTWTPGMVMFQQTGPTNRAFTPSDEFTVFSFSGPGVVEGTISRVGDDELAHQGCQESDFVGFNADVALIKRGDCAFSLKVQNAVAAGASAVLVYYLEGQEFSTVRIAETTVPAFGLTYEAGYSLFSQEDANVTVRLESQAQFIEQGVSNVCLDIPGGDKNSVVVCGAHMDSVLAGPGINDDGSGTALVLELLRTYGQHYGFSGNNAEVRNALRLCWWASEEWGLLGSRHYVGSLSQDENNSIAGYLNFDMMGSSNGFNSIINGASDPRTPEASGYIMHAFEDAFTALGQNWSLWGPSGSDFVAFLESGIPAGAIRSGAGQIKTEEEALRFGGTANEPFDPCYHRVCDTIENVDTDRMLIFSQVGATLVQNFVEDPDLATKLKRGPPDLVPTPAPTSAPTPAPPIGGNNGVMVWIIAIAVVAVGLALFIFRGPFRQQEAPPLINDRTELGRV